MPSAGLESAITASEGPSTHALDHAAIGISFLSFYLLQLQMLCHSISTRDAVIFSAPDIIYKPYNGRQVLNHLQKVAKFYVYGSVHR